MRKTLVLILVTLALGILWAQEEPPEARGTGLDPDTLFIRSANQDSLFYAADSIAYNHSLEQIRLFGNTSVRYHEFTISSDSLLVDLKNKKAYSYGNTVMEDGQQILLGTDVAYDMDTQTGTMSAGVSTMEKAFYTGEDIRKISADVYDVDNGSFTTCEYAEPDFWFTARQLRIYRGDMVVGRPVIAYVNHLPVFYFPFITIPLRRGRHPGFLIPEPGYNNVDGKFLKDISWYFPYKDYADLITSFDLHEKTGWRARLSVDYVVRYLLNGAFEAAYQKKISYPQTYYDWYLRANHHHEVGNNSTFDMNIDFVSNKRMWESSTDIDESLAQRVTSSISFRKPLLSSYLNVGATYTEDLINDQASVSLPSASFSLPTRPLYELFYRPQRSPDAWWSNISYNYGVRFNHTGTVKDPDRTWQDLIWNNVVDPADSTSYLTLHNAGLKHNLGLSYNWKLRGWLSVRHGLNYNEAWFDRDREDNKFVRGNDYSAYTNTSFNIYGIRNFGGGWLKSIRHIITPSAGITLYPDFSDNSRFYSFGGIGLRSSDKTASLNLSLDQKWQLKYGEDRRINDLFGLTSGISANLYEDERKFGNLSHRVYFRPGSFRLGNLEIPNSTFKLEDISLGYSSQYSLSHDPYELNLLDWKPQSQYFSHSLSFSAAAPYAKYFQREKNRIFDPYRPADSLQVFAEELTALEDQDTWKVSVSHDLYGTNSILDPSSNNLRFNTSLKLTDNWSLSYGNYYNLETKELISQTMKITRDLHCWKLDLSYTRRNEFWEYRITLFNTVLPDALRFTTHDSKRY